MKAGARQQLVCQPLDIAMAAKPATFAQVGNEPKKKSREPRGERCAGGRSLMLKDRRAAAIKVAQSLFAAEEAIDAALARAAELNATMVTARTEAQLSALVGQDAFECR